MFIMPVPESKSERVGGFRADEGDCCGVYDDAPEAAPNATRFEPPPGVPSEPDPALGCPAGISAAPTPEPPSPCLAPIPTRSRSLNAGLVPGVYPPEGPLTPPAPYDPAYGVLPGVSMASAIGGVDVPAVGDNRKFARRSRCGDGCALARCAKPSIVVQLSSTMSRKGRRAQNCSSGSPQAFERLKVSLQAHAKYQAARELRQGRTPC